MLRVLGKYLLNILIAVDQLANTILGGDPDETISSRLGKWKRCKTPGWRRKTSRFICWCLHPLDRNHCLKSIEEDEGKDGVTR